LAKHKEKFNKKLVAISRILKRIKQEKLVLQKALKNFNYKKAALARL
jgi:exonuclease VII small subunit